MTLCPCTEGARPRSKCVVNIPTIDHIGARGHNGSVAGKQRGRAGNRKRTGYRRRAWLPRRTDPVHIDPEYRGLFCDQRHAVIGPVSAALAVAEKELSRLCSLHADDVQQRGDGTNRDRLGLAPNIRSGTACASGYYGDRKSVV